MTSRSLAVLLVVFLAGAAPAADDSLAEQARVVLRNRCVRCHSAGPQAKAGLHILDPGQLLQRNLVVPGKGDSSELIQLVRAGHMPPDEQRVESEELQTLTQWIDSGAAPFPPEVGEAYVLDKIREDLTAVPAAIRAKQRYISFNHLLLDPEAANVRPEVYRHALIQALNHVSRKRTPVRRIDTREPTGTLFRIDLGEFGWDERPFELDNPAGGGRQPSPLDWWDLVLLEYPYATVPRPDPRARGERDLLLSYLREAEVVRPIPYVRGDWLIEALLSSPLYEEFLRLPRSARELEGELGVVRGPGAPRPLLAGFSQGRDHHILARRPGRNGASWWWWDMPGKTLADQARSLANREELFPEKLDDPYAAGGQVVFPLPNGLPGFYQFDGFGRLRQSPPGEKATADHRGVALGLGCVRCHRDGVQSVPAGASAREALEGADLPGNEKERLLALFPPQEVLDRLLGMDREGYQAALAKAHGSGVPDQPLDVVTRLYRDWAPSGPPLPLQFSLAKERERLRAYLEQIGYKGPQPAAGETILPLDSLTHFDLAPVREGPEGKPVREPWKLTVTTYRVKQDAEGKEIGREVASEFEPGDRMVMTIRNDGDQAVFLEMLVLTMDGEMYLPLACRPLAAGNTLEYPRDVSVRRTSVELQPPYGKDWYILYAAPFQYKSGEVHRIKGHPRKASKRIIHPLYQVNEKANGIQTLVENPSGFTKILKEVRTVPKK